MESLISGRCWMFLKLIILATLQFVIDLQMMENLIDCQNIKFYIKCTKFAKFAQSAKSAESAKHAKYAKPAKSTKSAKFL